MDVVWENIIKQIGTIEVKGGRSLTEEIAIRDKQEVLQKKIAALEKKAREEIQPRKKYDLVQEKRNLEQELSDL